LKVVQNFRGCLLKTLLNNFPSRGIRKQLQHPQVKRQAHNQQINIHQTQPQKLHTSACKTSHPQPKANQIATQNKKTKPQQTKPKNTQTPQPQKQKK